MSNVDRHSTSRYRLAVLYPEASFVTDSDYLFGIRLRKDREAAGMTVRQLAQFAAINYSYITKIERSTSRPGVSDTVVRSLAVALGADEYEYLYLSRLIPESVEPILATEEARGFLHEATSRNLDAEDWQALRQFLAGRLREPNRSKRASKPRSVA